LSKVSTRSSPSCRSPSPRKGRLPRRGSCASGERSW